MKFAHALLAAIIGAAMPTSTLAAHPALACQANVAGDVLIVQNGEPSVLRSIGAQMRTAVRGLGFGGVGQYAALPGPRALLRLSGNPPSFIVAAPANVQPQGLFTLARFEPRRNGTREILIGGGYMSFSTGVSADRVVAMTVVEARDQRNRPAGTMLYELTPTAALPAGEYALIVQGNQQQQTGAFNMPGLTGAFYDFGVD